MKASSFKNVCKEFVIVGTFEIVKLLFEIVISFRSKIV